MAYNPSVNATAGDPWDVAFLSDRDVQSQVPINFVPRAGVILTPACFHDGVYDEVSLRTCLSNLIASELRRFVIDVYWHRNRRSFQLCPVELPFTNSSSTESTAPVGGRVAFTSADFMTLGELRPRQTVNATSTELPSAAASTSASPLATVTSASSGTVLVQVGSYQCSPSLGLDAIASVFKNYWDGSANTLDARLQLIILNLHVARSYTALDTPVSNLTSSELPQGSELLSNRFGAISDYLYWPSQLEEDRENLNASWYRRSDAELLPLNYYYQTETLPNGAIRTRDGWPNENFVQLYSERRALLGYGIIDTQIAGYAFDSDGAFYPPGELFATRNVSIDGGNGQIESGCFYNSSSFELAQVNSSWATSIIATSNLNAVWYAADNFTSCGISPILNATLENSNAEDRPDLYQRIGKEALFSWAFGEPADELATGNSIDSAQYRCAVMVSSSDYKGHWKVGDCQNRYPVACRTGNQPYQWQISSNAVSYARGPSACSGNSSFDVPRTGLENTYLYNEVLREVAANQRSSLLDGIWINFNSLDIEGCWVTSGPSGLCPYTIDQDAVRMRQILIPALGAMIVLVLTIITILVKCCNNRRNSKIRRRGDGGWEYEGVPS